MIIETTTNRLTFYQFSIGYYCFLAFTLAELLENLILIRYETKY